MASRSQVPLAQSAGNVDPYITKSQIKRTYQVSDAEVKALVKLGYLLPLHLGPRMTRYERLDVEAGVKAFLAGAEPPAPTMAARIAINWEA